VAAAHGFPEQITRARALHSNGQLEAAIFLCREILAANPGSAEAHYVHANVLNDLGQLQAALDDYDRAILLKPDYAYALCNRAVVLGRLGKLPEALASYDRALEIDPSDGLAWCNRGGLLLSLSRRDEALASFDAAIARRPDFFPAHFSRAALLQERTDWASSLASYDRAIAINANDLASHYNRGQVLLELHRWEAALANYDRAITLDPNFHRAHAGRAQALHRLGQLTAALASYDRAIELGPGEATSYNNRGVVLQELGKLDEALADFDHALAVNPDYAKAHFNRGTVLQRREDPDAALASYERAISANSEYADAYVNRGVVLASKGLLQEAISSYQRAIHIDPNLAEAYYDLALASLKSGDLLRGWVNYEWRWRAKIGPVFSERRHFPEPCWLGEEPIAGKTMLLYGEQGMGDSLQFCRYVPLVAARGARVILEVPSPLVSLCATLDGVAQVVAYGTPLPDFDFQCPLMSLPLAFNTSLETIPTSLRYLAADTDKVASWQQRMGAKSKPQVGLAWSGMQAAGADRKRHVPLAVLTRFLPTDLRYVCLQTDVNEADRKTLAEHPEILFFDTELKGFNNTAALCDCMDLVLSVDTSIAHLSGALGRPTWVLLPFNADWRWLVDREDSPWYPTMRLYRQQSPGDWRGILERVSAQLRGQFT